MTWQQRSPAWKQGLPKLTEENVRFIRSSKLKLIELAKMYDVTKAAISHVKNYKSWKGVK